MSSRWAAFSILALLALSACGSVVRPFAEADLVDHRDPGVSSLAAGAILLRPDGMRFRIGPAVHFDFAGGSDASLFANRRYGLTLGLDWVNPWTRSGNY